MSTISNFDDHYVDQRNRRFPVRNQWEADEAARAPEIVGYPLWRERLAVLARRANCLLFTNYAAEVEKVNVALGDYATGAHAKFSDPTLDRVGAELMAKTPVGVLTLAKRNLKPCDPSPDFDPNAPVTFSKGKDLERDSLDRDLAMTEMGKSVLRRRGYDERQIARLEQS